jgi:hypothetical protein
MECFWLIIDVLKDKRIDGVTDSVYFNSIIMFKEIFSDCIEGKCIKSWKVTEEPYK